MAIPIPSLPTDNLYKFLALSGLFTFIFSIWLTGNMLQNFNNLQNNITEEAKTATTMRNLLPQNRIAEYDLSSAEIKLFKEFAKLSISSETKFDELKKQLPKVRFLFIILIATAILGLSISCLGFRLWYLKVQKPLDEILQLNLKKAGLEASSLE